MADTRGVVVLDDFCHRYRLSFRQIKESQLQQWLQYARLGGAKYDMSSLRDEVNNLFRESFTPCPNVRCIHYSIGLADMVVGELIRLSAPPPSSFLLEVMVYNQSSLLVLKDSTKINKPGNIVRMPQGANLKDYLCHYYNMSSSEIELYAVLPGLYHRSLDRVLLPQLHCKKSASTLMSLYETLIECMRQNRFCQEFHNICGIAMENGLSIFVIRALVDMLTLKIAEDEA